MRWPVWALYTAAKSLLPFPIKRIYRVGLLCPNNKESGPRASPSGLCLCTSQRGALEVYTLGISWISLSRLRLQTVRRFTKLDHPTSTFQQQLEKGGLSKMEDTSLTVAVRLRPLLDRFARRFWRPNSSDAWEILREAGAEEIAAVAGKRISLRDPKVGPFGSIARQMKPC